MAAWLATCLFVCMITYLGVCCFVEAIHCNKSLFCYMACCITYMYLYTTQQNRRFSTLNFIIVSVILYGHFACKFRLFCRCNVSASLAVLELILLELRRRVVMAWVYTKACTDRWLYLVWNLLFGALSLRL
jgi:hypothetical protein